MNAHAVHPTSLRLPSDLKLELKERAKANRRSLTGEIIAMLERAVAAEAQERV